jgi:hypothetical protein
MALNLDTEFSAKLSRVQPPRETPFITTELLDPSQPGISRRPPVRRAHTFTQLCIAPGTGRGDSLSVQYGFGARIAGILDM